GSAGGAQRSSRNRKRLMGSIGYAWQKTYEAIRMLVGEGSIKKRLEYAASGLLWVDPEDLPNEESRRRFVGIKRSLTKDKPDPDEGSIHATISGMSEQQAEELAQEILTLFMEVSNRYDLDTASERKVGDGEA
ncbi:MAG: hypothetical protein ACRD3V_16445, partial [Vicinamibacteria bacterium]